MSSPEAADHRARVDLVLQGPLLVRMAKQSGPLLREESESERLALQQIREIEDSELDYAQAIATWTYYLLNRGPSLGAAAARVAAMANLPTEVITDLSRAAAFFGRVDALEVLASAGANLATLSRHDVEMFVGGAEPKDFSRIVELLRNRGGCTLEWLAEVAFDAGNPELAETISHLRGAENARATAASRLGGGLRGP